jgi:hypothetical protein
LGPRRARISLSKYVAEATDRVENKAAKVDDFIGKDIEFVCEVACEMSFKYPSCSLLNTSEILPTKIEHTEILPTNVVRVSWFQIRITKSDVLETDISTLLRKPYGWSCAALCDAVS